MKAATYNGPLHTDNIFAATHNGPFHADDALAAAYLGIVFGDLEIVRTRDPKIIEDADIVFDVGGIYDSSEGRFDHHQADFDLRRPNGVKYSSFGLVFKHYWNHLFTTVEEMEAFDKILVQGVDAIDNGQEICLSTDIDVQVFDVSKLISGFNPSWINEHQDFDTAFKAAVNVARQVILNLIVSVRSHTMAKDLANAAYENAEDKRVVILDRFSPWQSVLCEYPEPLFVVFPDAASTGWRVQAVPVESDSFVSRLPFHEGWRGLRGQELSDHIGINGCVFCHKGAFIAGNETKEGAIAMAKLALNLVY